MSNIVIAALYHFTKLSDHKNLQAPLIEICNSQGIKGSLLLAFEGINGTIAGSRTGIDAVLKHLRAWPGCSNLEHKESHSSGTPFKRMKVKLKKYLLKNRQKFLNLSRSYNIVGEVEKKRVKKKKVFQKPINGKELIG